MFPGSDAPLDPDWDDTLVPGSVMRIAADYVYVAVAGTVYECRMRGKLKKAQMGVLVGDRVGLEEVDAQAHKATVAAVAPRRNALSKPAIANVDQALVVMAAKDPAFQPLLLDRFLVLVAERQVQAIILVNKIDRMAPGLWEEIQRTYAPHFPVLGVSAKQGSGIDDIMPHLAGKTSVLCGPSGVGKSSLLNTIQPGLQLSTGDISDWGRGTHTTRHVALHQIDTGSGPGLVADTPGFSLTDLAHIPPAELGHYFPEFVPLLGRCRFTDCLHDAEPECAVRETCSDSSRYATYLDILSELTTDKPLFFATRSTKDEGGTKTRTVAGGRRSAILRLDTEAREASRRLTKQQMQQLRGGFESDEGDDE
jgi:ribosome biogenesis GTPase